MKCTCGAYKTYGARIGSPLHSEWCDTRKFDYDALGEALKSAVGKMAAMLHTQQVKYCNWMHWPANQKPAVKVVRYGFHTPMYACQDCLNAASNLSNGGGNFFNGCPVYTWDLNDPNAPAVP